jgi:predicted nucleic acid-binding Zn ribbon protein
MKTPWHTARLGSALQRALERQGLSRAVREQEVIIRWEEIVGTAIANHAAPERIRNGVLWIQVTDASWRHELHLMRGGLVERINKALGETVVQELRLR